MGEACVFGPYSRIELLEGALVDMVSSSSAHASVVTTLATLLDKEKSQASVRVQGAVVLSAQSVPSPDVMLLRSRADRYYTAHPTAADALLVVEVADTSLEYDLEIKRSVYARAEVEELWIVDINRREVHVFRAPHGDYSVHRVLAVNDVAAVAALGDVGFTVSALFPDQ